MKSFLYSPERSEGTLLPKALEGSTMNPKSIGNNKPFFQKSRSQRGLCRAFFARWGGQREIHIAKKGREVLL